MTQEFHLDTELHSELKYLRDKVAMLQEELRKTREESEASKQYDYLEAILSVIPDIVFILDEEGVYLDIITSREELLFCDAPDLIGKRLHDVLPQDVADGALDTIRRALISQISQHFEYSLSIDGTTHWFEGRAVALPRLQNHKERQRTLWIARDITGLVQYKTELEQSRAALEVNVIERTERLRGTNEQLRHEIEVREQTEEALIRALARLREQEVIINQSPTIVFRFRAEENWPVEYVSDNIRQFGYTPEEFICGKRSWREITHPDDIANLIEEKDLKFHSERHIREYRREYRIFTAKGEIRWLSEHTVPRYDGTGMRITHFQGIVTDISDRKRAEEAHRASEARMRALVDNLPFDFWAMDMQGRYSMQNAVSREHWGDVIGKTPTDLGLSPDVLDAWLNQDRRARDGELVREPFTREIEGQPQFFHNIITPVIIDGHKDGILGVTMDVTEQTIAQEAMIRSERMAAVGVLAAGVAHEYNNIHTSMLGFLQLLQESPHLTDEDRTLLERVHRSGKRATNITRNLLAFSRRSVASMGLHNIHTLIHEVIEILDSSFRNEGITIASDLQKVGPFVFDYDQISQVVLNLLINAHHAVIARPEKKVFIHVHETDGFCEILIRDTGIGIPKDDLPNLFLPFFTTKGEHAAKGSTQTVVRGTGLGLSVSDTIVKAHDGEILVESQVDSGTTFTVRLPLRETLQKRTETKKDENHAIIRGKRILVIDDEVDITEYLGIVLGREGAKVRMTHDARDALEILKAETFDLILLDLQMPEMHGIDFLREYRDHAKGEIPIIIVSGKILQKTTDEIKTFNVQNIVQKPFVVHTLFDSICATLDGRTNRDPSW